MAGGYGIGPSLASMGQSQFKEAQQTLAASADEESRRNAHNQLMEAQAKSEKRQLGSTVGAMAGFYAGSEAGSVGGPWGALIGGALGYVAGGLL